MKNLANKKEFQATSFPSNSISHGNINNLIVKQNTFWNHVNLLNTKFRKFPWKHPRSNLFKTLLFLLPIHPSIYVLFCLYSLYYLYSILSYHIYLFYSVLFYFILLYLSIYLSIYLFVYLSIYLSIYLSLYIDR